MKFIIPIVTLILGFGVGWHFSGKRIQENVKAVMPNELHESIEAAAEYLEPMTKEEANAAMQQIRDFALQAVDEGNHQALWDGLNADIYKRTLNNEGNEAAIEFADAQLLFFHEQYEEGLELGEWQKVADSLYSRTKMEENQSQ